MIKKMYSLVMVSALLAGVFIGTSWAHQQVAVVPLNTGSKPIGDAEAVDVLEGKTFSSGSAVGVGGAMANIGAQSISPSTSAQTITEGYHNGSGSVAGDTDLAAANIANGTEIFGVTGSALVATGTATADQVLTGRTFSNGSAVGVGGAMANIGAQSITPSTSAQTITEGYHNGSGSVAGDTDLVGANIKSGTEIFGVTGTMPLIPVPRTGQTPSLPFAAPAGSDGAHQKGTAWPDPRFSDNSDGTVTDNLTGLIWLKNANCTDTVGGVDKSSSTLTWDNALTWSNGLANGDCGLTDLSSAGHWRLPNVLELQSLIAWQYASPALSNDAGTGIWGTGTSSFSSVQSNYYWSSTTYAGGTVGAWSVDLFSGFVGNGYKTNSYFVWPVRD